MDVVVLGGLIEFTTGPFAVDHPASHGDGRRKDAIEKIWVARMAYRVDASFREGEVDGLGKVQGSDGRVPEIWINSAVVP